MKEYNPRETYILNTGKPAIYYLHDSIVFTNNYVEHLEEQNKQMLNTIIKIQYNAEQFGVSGKAISMQLLELIQIIEQITGKKIEEEV